MRKPLLLLAAALLLLPVAGCGGNDKHSSAPPSSTVSTGPVVPGTFVTGLLAAIDKDHSVRLHVDAGSFGTGDAEVSYGNGPTTISVNGKLRADGPSSFVVSNGVVYVQQGAGGQYMKIDDNDPNYGPLLRTFTEIGPHETVAGLGQGIQSVTSEGVATVDGERLHQYDVKADPSRSVGALRALAGSSGISSSLMFVFYVDDDGLLRQVETDVNGGHVTVKLSDWGKPVSIHVPTAEEITNG